MKIVRVQYTTTAEYARVNKANIEGIVKELKTLNYPGIRYRAYLLPDGKTFMHLDHLENEEAHELLQSLPSFKKFAAELEASQVEEEPKLELPGLIATNEEGLM